MVPFTPMANQTELTGHMVRVSDEAWAEAMRWAAALGCTSRDGEPSVARLVAEIGEGSIQVTRVRAATPRSMAARIRAQIDLTPEAKDAAIAELLGATAMQVCKERLRYAQKKAAAAGEA